MKVLHLIRHAKSSWGVPHLADADRPLNKRGRHACGIMAGPIADAGCSFANIYCSVAQRAQMTIEGIAAALPNRNLQWQLDENLYTFSDHALLVWVHRLDEALEEVVMVGHNPGLTDFCNSMTNAGISNMPTCSYAQLTFPVDHWNSVQPGTGELTHFLTPKSVADPTRINPPQR